MNKYVQRVKTPAARCMLWVALCFTLTSGVYLSWLDRLVTIAGAPGADWMSMVAGYLFQAGGLGLTALWLRKRPEGNHGRSFQIAAVLLFAVTVPALITDTVPCVIAFGWVMNALCGMIAGGYLYGIGTGVEENRYSTVFGGGYAIATVAAGVLALVGKGPLIHGKRSLLLFATMTAGLVWMSRALDLPKSSENKQKTQGEPKQAVFAFGVIILISLVKNLGFGFPSADIQAGLIPEITRIPYAVGLAAAGLISAKNRRNGMICTVAAMIIPFLMLGLTHEPVSSTIFWGLDYFFFAFFSVFRVVLFLDLAYRTRRWELAPMGLLAGRIGDAAGTGIYMALEGEKIILIAVAGALFIPAVFFLFRLYENMYDLDAVQARMERERFRTFCEHHDFSDREQDIFRLMMDGKTYAEIAGEMYITENTVKYHVRNILQKTGCRSRVDMKKKYNGMEDKAETGKDTEKPYLRVLP